MELCLSGIKERAGMDAGGPHAGCVRSVNQTESPEQSVDGKYLPWCDARYRPDAR
jgi:hypothetical protein